MGILVCLCIVMYNIQHKPCVGISSVQVWVCACAKGLLCVTVNWVVKEKQKNIKTN